MKRFVVGVFALLFINSGFGYASEVHVSVKGMVCGFCAQGITKKFSSEAAVESLTVSLETKLVTLKLKSGQSLSDERIRALLSDAGYSTEKIERK